MPLTTETTEQNGWGGAGRGQGRKPLNGKSKMVRITVTLSEEDVALLDHLSPLMRDEKGVRARSRSEGVRWALRALHRETKALMAEANRIEAEAAADPSLIVTEEELERAIAAKVAAMQNAGIAVHVEN